MEKYRMRAVRGRKIKRVKVMGVFTCGHTGVFTELEKNRLVAEEFFTKHTCLDCFNDDHNRKKEERRDQV